MTGEEARRRFAAAPVARLATTDGAGRPHLVPIVFAIEGDTLISAVDHKPKRTSALRRLDNVRENPRVAVLVDEYSDDWDRLWWARADGSATVLAAGSPEAERALPPLIARYHQYRHRPPGGPVLRIAVERWSGWAAGGSDPGRGMKQPHPVP